jgi:methylphosphotriester-DNA--protein-cysteine methyltransferase
MKEKRTKAKSTRDADTMRPEYDFSKAVRGKYHTKYLDSTNVVVLDPDVAAGFKNSEAVNDALRALLRIARQGEC